MTHFDKSIKVDEVTGGCFAMSTHKPVGLWKLYPDCSVTLPSICQIPREGFTTTSPTTTLSSTTPLPPCADTWQPYGQYCYKIADETQQWHVAQQICTHYGSSLASIHDNGENTAVAEMAGQSDVFWIGLHDTEIEGVFKWEDGSLMDFFSWNTYEPNNANNGEDCTELLTGNKLWNDADCYGAKRYVCKIPRGKAVNEVLPTIDSFPACDENSPDDGWVTYGEYCYFLGKEESLTWHAAKMYCRNKGSTLASVHSEEEQRFLFGLNSKSGDVSWIGFNDLDLDNRFSWSDGSVVDFIAWASGQPNDILGGEKCVPIYTDGTWHDYPCNDRKPFICKKRKDGNTMTTTAPTTKSIKGGCPSGFNYTFGNKCYYFSADGNTEYWGAAKDRCGILGGHLVSIHSKPEKDFIALNVYGISHGMWLGMQDLDDDRQFDWSDNSPLDYSNWAPNEPSSNVYDTFEKEPCVEILTNLPSLGFWNDVKCYASRGYICSAFKDSSRPILNNDCPEGYTLMRQSCYKIVTTKQSWNQSLDSCSTDGGHMISLLDFSDMLIIRVLQASIDQYEVWLGGVAFEGNVQWNDGSKSPLPVPDSVWSGCLYSSESNWYSVPCSETRASICVIRKESDSVSSTTSSTVKSALSSTVATTHTFTCRNSSWLLYNGFCYTTVFDMKTFPNTKCSKYGMDLASINSAKENFKIISWILQKRWSNSLNVYPYFWIGLSLQTGDVPVNMWTDGSSIVYSNIDTDNGGTKQGCVILMLFTGQWQVVSCTDKHFYVCKGRADVVTTLTPSSTTYSYDGNTTSTTFQLPPFHHGQKMTRVAEKEGLSGGQVAGVVIGVLGLLVMIGVVVYILRSWKYKKPEYTFEAPSLGFDNALFVKNQDTIDIN
ncbi:macrophage mannose receptor 1-like [Mercenaria mercenaria]|uniref:macrophage mannose receptor 1-like n=1 Tax=Mercenaria mercenaria TaxID=6596 RepID=UPI00234EB9E5|nr:macrophage mannose receptor 1-like [Mercenaria mercenaria]